MTLEQAPNFPKHLPPIVVSSELAHAILNRLLFAHLVNPVPIQSRAAAEKLPEFIPAFIKETESRNRHTATFTVQVMLHQIVILEPPRIWGAWYIGVGRGFAIVLLVARKYPQYDLVGIPRRHVGSDRQIAMHIRTPVFAD